MPFVEECHPAILLNNKELWWERATIEMTPMTSKGQLINLEKTRLAFGEIRETSKQKRSLLRTSPPE